MWPARRRRCRDDLRLVLVRDRAVRQDHAVLAVRHDGRWLMLDNRHSMLIERSDAAASRPCSPSTTTGVHLFAAPYAKRAPADGQRAAAPAAAAPAASVDWTDTGRQWNGSEPVAEGHVSEGDLPLVF